MLRHKQIKIARGCFIFGLKFDWDNYLKGNKLHP